MKLLTHMFARPDDTTAYTTGDVIGSATGAVLEIPLASSARKVVRILSASVLIKEASALSGLTGLRLHFYSSSQQSAYEDNAVFDIPAGDSSYYHGYVDFGAPVDMGSSLYAQSDELNHDIFTSDSGSIFMYLTCIGGFTPSATTECIIRINIYEE